MKNKDFNTRQRRCFSKDSRNKDKLSLTNQFSIASKLTPSPKKKFKDFNRMELQKPPKKYRNPQPNLLDADFFELPGQKYPLKHPEELNQDFQASDSNSNISSEPEREEIENAYNEVYKINTDPVIRYPKQKSCSTCYEVSNKTYRTPRCLQHEYCERCIKQGPKSRNCDYCNMYFASLTRENNEKIYQCTLCKLSPSYSDIRCKVHLFCSSCSEFLISNEYSHIVKVANCEECSSSLQNIKGNNRGRPKTILNIERKEEEKIKSIIKIETVLVDLTENLNERNVDVPSGDLSRNSNEIPEICINPGLNSNPIEQNLDLSANNDLVVRECDANIRDLPGCGSVPSCCFCSDQLNVKSFLCNHCMCIECMVQLCLYQINTFFTNYYQGKVENSYRFSYVCIFQGCGMHISVSTYMVLNYLSQFLNDPSKYEKFACYYYLLENNTLFKWIEYFDGLSNI